MTHYNFVKRLSDDIVVLYSEDYGNQVWNKCKVRANKECYITSLKLKGQYAYRPIGSEKYNRMDRIGIEGIKYLEEMNHG